MIAIIDYNAGNIRSVENALARLGCEYELTADPSRIRAADKVILPGVGNAAAAVSELRERGLVPVILSLRRPVLGICVGLQVLCRDSEEGPCEGLGLFDAHVRRFPTEPRQMPLPLTGSEKDPCRGMLPASDRSTCPNGRMRGQGQPDSGSIPREGSFLLPESGCSCPAVERPAAKVPHMGWNEIGNLDGKLFKDLKGGANVYFVHSYYPTLGPDTIATCRHGDILFSAALKYENFYGTQFHPEKSGAVGERILRNFLGL